MSAELGLTLSGGSVSYTLDGRFGIARQPMVLLEGTAAQQAFVVTLQEGKTALTVGTTTGGARVGLGKLEGALILGTLNGKFGAAGTLTIGEVSLTKADGTSALIPGLTILPVDLPFSFNLFELNPGQKPASSWGSFSFSLPSFPHFDFSAPSLPSFSLPNLKLSLPNLDISKFSFPDLAALLPSLGLDLPSWSLKLPNISLPSISLGGGGTGGGGGSLPSIDWANLKLPNLVFQLPRLNFAGLKVDFTKLLSAIDFGALSWPEVTLPNLTLGGGGINWLNLGLSDLLQQLKGLNLPGISFTLPSAW
ncbi:MAG: hypothetical protein ACKO9W_15260, partial [Bacteroidota bacterium]